MEESAATAAVGFGFSNDDGDDRSLEENENEKGAKAVTSVRVYRVVVNVDVRTKKERLIKEDDINIGILFPVYIKLNDVVVMFVIVQYDSTSMEKSSSPVKIFILDFISCQLSSGE